MTASRTPPAPSIAPRAAAWELIGQVLMHKRGLSDVLSNPPADFAALAPADRARAQRLCAEAFRHHGRADILLRRALRKTPSDAVLWILRLAVVEMCELGAPAHGVINDAVTMTRDHAEEPRLAALVNAVLRQMASLPPADWAATPTPRLPSWLRGALQNAYGAKVTAAIEAAHMTPPPLDLTLRGAVPDGLAGQMLPTGSLRVTNAPQVTTLPGYNDGQWWVQNAAAALPAQLLAPQAGERVLDLCAAPGGKTLQLAAAGAQVTALDMSAPRMARLAQNLTRTGLLVETVVADALHWRPDAPFDAILLDAPCSATGTIRRHPDLPYCRDRAQVKALVALQAALLDRALDPAFGLLRAGGRVVFCTCSLLPEEGEEQVKAALARHPSVRIVPAALDGVPDDWLSPDGGIRTRPDHWAEFGGIDGFYIAQFQHLA
jgi:16S rRNA (cytosine967-C5)-methyltransferase